MKYAIISTGGKQIKVSEKQLVTLEKIKGKAGDTIIFDQVLLLVDNGKTFIGEPFLENCRIKAKLLKQTKGKKIRVATYKAKSRYRRVKGHRQQLSQVVIEKINKSATKIGKSQKSKAPKTSVSK